MQNGENRTNGGCDAATLLTQAVCSATILLNLVPATCLKQVCCQICDTTMISTGAFCPLSSKVSKHALFANLFLKLCGTVCEKLWNSVPFFKIVINTACQHSSIKRKVTHNMAASAVTLFNVEQSFMSNVTTSDYCNKGQLPSEAEWQNMTFQNWVHFYYTYWLLWINWLSIAK